jgi:hypothetical protein
MAIDPKTGRPIDNATLIGVDPADPLGDKTVIADVRLTRTINGAVESSLTAQDIQKAVAKLKEAHLPININIDGLAKKLAHEAAYQLDMEVANSMKPSMKFYSNVLGAGGYGVMPNAREIGNRTQNTKLIIIAGTMHELSSFIDSKRSPYKQVIKIGKKEYKPEEIWGITTNNGIDSIQGLEFKDMQFAFVGTFEKGSSFSEMIDYIISHDRS